MASQYSPIVYLFPTLDPFPDLPGSRSSAPFPAPVHVLVSDSAPLLALASALSLFLPLFLPLFRPLILTLIPLLTPSLTSILIPLPAPTPDFLPLPGLFPFWVFPLHNLPNHFHFTIVCFSSRDCFLRIIV